MNRFKYIGLLIYTSLAQLFAFAQGEERTCQNDRVILCSDRNIYVAGEIVRFAVHISNEDKAKQTSNVVYIELISSEGQRIVSGKYSVENQAASGSFAIPSDVITGNYYLKAYTKWMRNFSVTEYFFSSVKIINPYRQEVQNNSHINATDDSTKASPVTEPYCPFNIVTKKEDYSLHEKASFIVSKNNSAEVKWANISIAPRASINNHFDSRKPTNLNHEEASFYSNESKGIIISGKVYDVKSSLPLPYTKVNLSLLGAASDFISVLTDSLGSFNFNMPFLEGKHELYIGIEDKSNASIKIDNDYCSRSLRFHAPPFDLSANEREAVQKMVYNMEIQSSYHSTNEVIPSNQTLPVCSTLFYGTSDYTLLLDDYINLLSIEEYFHELYPDVSVRKDNEGNPTFRIYGEAPEMQIYKPLVLIDLVAVTKAESILSLNPSLISRIEIITKPYYKGEMIFGGILSFFSKKGDMAGVDLPPTDMFLEFDFFSPDSVQTITNEELPVNIPDTKNTVLWIGNASDLINRNSTIPFSTPDTPGEYTILLRGLGQDGKFFHCSKNITIK
ncbi:MAG TPA: MG2 domain-containing protein [Tenuifilaceae bacterium]|nr:MG2 domain-containing protein [Tenuifilaceae bacterium]HPE17753.1 MG2 domain-containing protein [Tenuifilaceae bacterium]HPQ34132.1 MG2 domain-containing protein [Tenuifilaceae bacterium]HRX67168.1 MG2 domain-containing protein [Tenuifilaceae bacterium]